MASNPFFTSCFQTSKSQSQQDQELHSYQLNKQYVSTLPSELGWGLPIRLYRHFWFPEAVLPGIISLQQNFPIASDNTDNVFLVTYPKSGTTWLKALAFAITNRTANYSASNNDHPLLSRHPQDCSPYLEGIFATASVPDITVLPTPRILATHCPYSVLPDSIKNSRARIVYLCREPKDTLVSMWHFANEMRPDNMAFEQVFELFCKGVAAYGPVWDHQLEYWKESLKRPENVLFLKYEEMKERPKEMVRRLAEFFGKKITEEEEGNGVVEEIVRLCSIENLKGLDVNKEGYRGKEINWAIKSSSFFRKGTVGDWREHFSPAMAERMDRITKEKLDGSDLSFELQLQVEE